VIRSLLLPLFAFRVLGTSAQVCDPNGNLFIFSNYDGGIVTINVDQDIPDLVIAICTYEPVQVTIAGPFAANVIQVIYAGMNSSQNNNNCGQGNFTSSIVGVDPGIISLTPPMEPPPVGYTPAHGNGYPLLIGVGGNCDTLQNAGGGNTPDEVVAYFEATTGATLYAHQSQYACWQNEVVSLSTSGNCCIDATPAVVTGCDPNGNVMIYSNYEGGTITINVDQDIPDLHIGICTYEAVQVNIIGPFAANVTEVIYAGFDGTNAPCGTNPPTTTINGVAPGIVTQYSETLGNIAIANYLGEPVAPGFPPLVNCITGAEGECSTSNSGGGNSAPQIAQFFLAEFGPGATLFGHQVQYDCFTGTFNLSDGGNCCLTETGTPPNPIYAGIATYDFIPWTDSLLCNGSITIDLSFYPVLFQPPTYPGYVWSDGTTGPVITITEPGTYSFIVGDYCHTDNGSWLTDTVVVLPCCSIGGVDTSSTTISCNGANDGTITVAPLAAGPFSYTWNTVPPQATPTITGLVAGTYTLVIDDGLGCDTTLTFTLIDPPAVVLELEGDPLLCAGDDVTVTTVAQGGNGVLSFVWSPVGSGDTYTFTPAATTTLTVTATDASGCTATDSITIAVVPIPQALFNLSTDTACLDQVITLSSTSTNADSLLWEVASGGTFSTSTISLSFAVPGEQTVTLIAFSDGGCSSTSVNATITVIDCCTLEDLNASSTPISCAGAADGAITVIALGVGPFTYTWGTDPPQNTPAITGLGPGTYTVVVADASGCDSTLTLTLTEPAELVLDVQGNTPLCSGAEVTISALALGGSGTIQLDWSPVGSGESYTFTPAATTTLTVTATDASGCTATDAITIEVLPLPSAAFTTSADTVCAGTQVTFTATAGADSLSWDLGSAGITNAIDPVATYLDPGVEIITLTAFNAAGCSSLPAVVSVRVAPLVQLSLVAGQPSCDRTIAVDLLALGADVCGLWLNSAPVATSCIGTLTLPVSNTGSYTLSLAGSNFAGCADTISTQVDVEDGTGLFVPNVFTPDNNGINDTFGIPWVAPGPGFVLRVFNRWGQELFTSNDPAVEWDGTVNGTIVPDGVYAYVISAQDPCSPGTRRDMSGHVTVLR